MTKKSRKRGIVIDKENEKKEEKEFIVPDGGWGWVIVAGFGFNNFFVIPIIYSYGLIFLDRFQELNFDPKDVTLLMSLNSWFGMILGIFNGPLLKKFGYRKMAFVGITFFVVGFFFTGIATKYVHFVICYGLINSIGYVLLMASFNLAFNTYFKVKRSHAAGRVAFLTAIGPIVIPQLISFLLVTYGVKWTVFILTAITLNAYAGACVLQPLKWHAKTSKEEEKKMMLEEEPEKDTEIPEVIAILECESPLSGSKLSLSERPSRKWCSQDISPKSSHLTFFDIRKSESEDVTKRKESIMELDNERHNKIMKSVIDLTQADIDEMSLAKEIALKRQLEKSKEKENWSIKLWEYVKNLYDLDLLVDPIYLNIMTGLSIASIGELMFSLLTPFILDELGLDLQQKAYFMSTVAFCDTIARLIAPYIGDRIKLQTRAMYGAALFFLFITRAFMFIPSSYEGFLVVAVGLGLGKGIRTVYWAIVIPDYVPIKKLPSAAAIQGLVNGILLALSGPIFGAVISVSGSYTNAIIACNILTITTIIMWCTEFGIIWYKNKKTGEANFAVVDIDKENI